MTRAAGALWCLVALATAAMAPMAGPGPGAGAAEAGRDFFRTGRAEPPVQARLLPAGRAVDARGFACAKCHGTDAGGGSEGTARPPPLTWAALGEPRPAGAGSPARPAYDEALLVRAITAGLDAGGRPLDPIMPRYAMLPEQAAALVAYLRVVGTADAAEPGVAEGSVRIGTAQPVSGPLADAGAAVAATLRHFCDMVNEEGGIYGRRLEFVLRDSGPRGAGDAVVATRLLLDEDAVFAVVAPFDGSASTAEPAAPPEADWAPVVGPIAVPSARAATTAHSTFFLLPPFRDQGRALVQHFVAEGGQGAAARRVLILQGTDGPAREAAEGAAVEAAARGLDVVGGGAAADGLAALLAAARPDAVFVLAPAPLVAAAAGAAARQGATPPPVYALTLLLGPGAPAAAGDVGAPVRLGHPFEPPAADGGFRRFAAARHLTPSHPVLQGLAYAAAATLVEGLKGAGRGLTRPGLVQAVERLPPLHTGVLPPLRFGPDRHTGPGGIYLMETSGEAAAPRLRAGPREASGR